MAYTEHIWILIRILSTVSDIFETTGDGIKELLLLFRGDFDIVVMLKYTCYLELHSEVLIIGEIVTSCWYIFKFSRKMGWGDRFNKISKILVIMDIT